MRVFPLRPEQHLCSHTLPGSPYSSPTPSTTFQSSSPPQPHRPAVCVPAPNSCRQNTSGESLASGCAAYSILQPQHRLCKWRMQAAQNRPVKAREAAPRPSQGLFQFTHRTLHRCSSPKSRLLLAARSLLLSLSNPPQENAVLWENSSLEACQQLQRSPSEDHDSLYKQRRSNPLDNV